VNKWLEAVKFQENRVAELARQPFDQLAARPAREEIQLPPRLRGIRCFIGKRTGDEGGVEITVGIEERLFFGRLLDPSRRRLRDISGRAPDRGLGVPLPANIASEVLRYLLLEYGESPNDPDALKLSDLSYEGEHLHEGVPTHFWSYASSTGKAYATVELNAHGYTIDMTKCGPGERPHARWWQFWRWGRGARGRRGR